MESLKVGIAGAGGRMGAAVLAALRQTPGLTASLALVRQGGRPPAGVPATESVEQFLERSDVVVDFSRPALLSVLAPACAAAAVPLVSGTTGLDDAVRVAVADAGRRVAVVHAPNFSVGVNVIAHLVEQASQALGNEWRCEIFDAHHAHKVDAPSGTALRLGSAVGRDVTYSVEREGDTVGFHEVRFDGPGERISIAHEALDRDIFALGALKAARWAVDKPPGLYGMDDVLGLK